MRYHLFVGFDSRELVAYQVCVRSLRARSGRTLTIEPVLEPHLRALGLYRRRHERRDGRLWDTLSEAPMSTEFALTRFLTPLLSRAHWAVFCDCDFLWRTDVRELLALADPRFAVMVVQHDYTPTDAVKMDGQIQLAYPRKNWSSLMLLNCRHPAHAPLPELVNKWAGRRLHGFEWLDDDLIGALPEVWNWLEGHSNPVLDPKAVHFTRGTPDLPGYHDVPYAEEWRRVRAQIDSAKGTDTRDLTIGPTARDRVHGGRRPLALTAIPHA
jgi:hypothetical protein